MVVPVTESCFKVPDIGLDAVDSLDEVSGDFGGGWVSKPFALEPASDV